MALAINTNTASLAVQRNLSSTSRQIETSIGRLSSGLRIATASDDAAGLVISEKMRAQIRSLQQAQRNANDGISVATIGDGALNEISSMLIRMRELAIQSLNGTNGTTERDALDKEYQAMKDEIGRISEVTAFNGVPLLNGTATGGFVFQVGSFTTANDTITISAVDTTITTLSLDTTFINGSTGAIETAVARLDSALATVNAARGDFGAAANRMHTTITTIGSLVQNTIAAESRIRDADMAVETAAFTRGQVLQSAGVSVLAQANTLSQAVLQLLRF